MSNYFDSLNESDDVPSKNWTMMKKGIRVRMSEMNNEDRKIDWDRCTLGYRFILVLVKYPYGKIPNGYFMLYLTGLV